MILEDFQERKEARRVLASWPALLLLGFLVVFAGWGVLKTALRYWEIRNSAVEIESKIAEEKKSAKDFKERAMALETPEGLEKEARSRFNLKKPGEEVVIFLDSNTPRREPTFRENLASAWESIKSYFIGLIF